MVDEVEGVDGTAVEGVECNGMGEGGVSCGEVA